MGSVWMHARRYFVPGGAYLFTVNLAENTRQLLLEVVDWPYTTFHRYAVLGIYPKDWAGVAGEDEVYGYEE